MTTPPTASRVEWAERKIILLLCVLAAVHVFIFSAAFPFFNNVDEAMHFDLVLKYSQGHVPQSREMISPASAGYLAVMNSHAYLGMTNQFPGGILPLPPWTLPAAKMHAELELKSTDWRNQENYEVSQTPLYYALAGLWWDIGQSLGMQDGRLLYWLRFLNIALAAATVWLAYAVVRIVFPDNVFLHIGVPALLAFMPQTAFYSLGNDVLSPLCFGTLFICVLKWLEGPSASIGGLTGAAFAATYLSKITNLPLLVIALVVVLIKTRQSLRQYRRSALEALIAFLLCSEPPIIGWMIWCKSNFGDVTGSAVKTDFLGWTIKPFSQWWHHPIFTPTGFWTYLSGQLTTFWQGEFWWHHQPMALPGTAFAYTGLSLVLLVAAMPALSPRFSNEGPQQRYALRISLLCFLAMLGFFALLSLMYDFHNCPYPSRQYPYFTSGRLLLGALIPFLLLVVCGLDRLLRRFGNATKFATLTIIILAMLALEISTDWAVFSNDFNWFHLP
jgi:hypothetical protein